MLRFLGNFAGLVLLVPPLAVAVAALGRINHPMADILVQFSAAVFFLTLALTIGLLVCRLYPAAGAAALVSLLLLAANWPQWMPSSAKAEGGESLSVYSANLWVNNQDFDALERSVKQADADVLIFVEFNRETHEQVDRLFADYPYRLYSGPEDRKSKSAILSRYPLTSFPGSKHRETVAAVAETPLGPVTLVGAHLTRPWPYQPPENQVDQIDRLTELRQTVRGPLILAGDFNAVSHGRIGRRVKADMGLIPAPGFPGTFPQKLPAFVGMTIDHVWHTPDLALTSRKLGAPNGSDHRPVVTRFSRAAPQ